MLKYNTYRHTCINNDTDTLVLITVIVVSTIVIQTITIILTIVVIPTFVILVVMVNCTNEIMHSTLWKNGVLFGLCFLV